MALDVLTRDAADPAELSDATIAVVGYGNLGAAMAHNLRNAGLTVVVGNRDDAFRRTAASDGFEVAEIVDAVGSADLVYVLISDEVIPACFETSIAPALRSHAAVCFASGYVLAYGLVSPPSDVDVLLLAPRMMGASVATGAGGSTGYVSFVDVEQDASGRGRERLLALALAAGALDRGALVVPATDEAALDLFVEQTVGPYVGTAIQLAFEVGVAAGLPAEALVLELYQSGEMSETFRTFAERGFYRAVAEHGLTAQFGGYLRTLELDGDAMRGHFESILDEIRNGHFAQRLQEEAARDYPDLEIIRAITSGDDPMSRAEARVRAALRPIGSVAGA